MEDIRNNCVTSAQHLLAEFQELEAHTIEKIENSGASMIDKRKMLVRVYKCEIEVLEAYEQFNANVSVDALASAKAFLQNCNTNNSILHWFCSLNCVEVLRQMEEEEANQKEMLINFINKF